MPNKKSPPVVLTQTTLATLEKHGFKWHYGVGLTDTVEASVIQHLSQPAPGLLLVIYKDGTAAFAYTIGYLHSVEIPRNPLNTWSLVNVTELRDCEWGVTSSVARP